MLNMFLLILIGFFLRKKRLLPDNAGTAMSKLETFVFAPALSFVTQLNNCNVANFKKYSSFMLYSLGIIVLAVILAYPLSRLFVRKKENDEFLRSVYKYSIAFANYGFLGNFLVLGVWGSEMLFKYTMFTFPMSFFCYCWGIPLLISDGGPKKGFIEKLKPLFNPPTIALILGSVLGLLEINRFIPSFVTKMLDSASDCMGPVAMLLAGFVIGGFEIKSLIADKKVYIVTALRLIVLPALFIFLLRLVNAPEECLPLALVAYAAPLGLNTIVYPAAYGKDTKPGASMAVISNTLCVITLPVMYLILL